MYFVINKIELVDGVVVTTPVNYTISNDLADQINDEYEASFGQWVKDNLIPPRIEVDEGFINDPSFVVGNIEDFFAETPFVLSVKQVTTDIEGMNLIEI